MNDRIRVPEVRLVGPAGEQVGVVRLEVALGLAQEADLDLVEVAPDARPPVCKLMDYGKFKYESDMKAREARRNQANTVLKEIRFRLKIDDHDYETKKGHVVRFLSAGDKVKVMIMFRGREQSRPEMGVRLLQRLAEDVSDLATVESAPKQDGRNMIMVLGPIKKKTETKTDQRRQPESTVKSTRAERQAARAAQAQQEQEAQAPSAPVEEVAPVVVEPAVVAPVEVVAEPVATEPAEATPVAVEPAVVEPAVVEPVAAKPVTTKPAVAKPVTTKPAVAKPAVAKPVAAKPAAAKPAAKPAVAKPVAAKPAAAKPAAAKPAAAKPAAKPVAKPAVAKKETAPKPSVESAEEAN
ncbi:translation initiation factor IF-3 [Jonesiaceae bacterium BS-20]|uniref:Translation initiation factor IF-3 n=1 Tax=Jonesiaceae bacterium BS-20 TaxID=3120821 RepID=A0AAU7DZK5_9MICO